MKGYKQKTEKEQREIANYRGSVLRTMLHFNVSKSTVCRLREKFGTNNRRGFKYKRREIEKSIM